MIKDGFVPGPQLVETAFRVPAFSVISFEESA